MRFSILSDTNWESKASEALDNLTDFQIRQFFEEKDYGETLKGITIVFMCRKPDLVFKQRIRQSKSEKKLYLDLMLDFNQFIRITEKEREKIIAHKLITEVPAIIKKYKFADFDLPAFESDLRSFLEEIEWL